MIDVKQLIEEPSESFIESLVDGGNKYHKWYNDTVDRASIMSMFYNGADVEGVDTNVLRTILPQSVIESDDDYEKRLERTPILPFEKKFVRAKERIFQGHGVSRDFPEDNEFWAYIQKHFDDQGAPIDKFFRKKVFHYKEVLGFAGIVVDLLTKVGTTEDGETEFTTLTDANGDPVPYPYLVKPEEIYNFEFSQGYLKYVVLRQDVSSNSAYDSAKYKYTALTPRNVYVYKQYVDDKGQIDHTERIIKSEHPFGEVPFVVIKGDEDLDSGYRIGRPERYSLIPMYRTAIEIYYDLQEVSLLYGHPIPVMSEETVKQLIGSIDDDGKYNPENISASLGAVVQIPDGEDFPKDLFYQPDTSGLQHLYKYLFQIIDSVHKFASIRDKSHQVANNSGVSKAMDTVEERGILASASRDMETTERKVLSLMASVREDKFDPEWIKYQKEFDLSTADEHINAMIEGSSNNALTFELYRYHALESLRKSGAPQEDIKRIKEDLDEFGKPLVMDAQEVLEFVRDADLSDKEQKEFAKRLRILQHFTVRNKQNNETKPTEQEDNEE